jgi:pyridoxine kinase
MQDGIISIQSHVAYGHVGNSAAVFPLQRLGHEVWPVNTVLFSNHTGYGAWRGQVMPVETVREVLAGMEERGGFDRAKAVLSGYLGSPVLGEAVLEAVSLVQARRPDALYVCDPVMGDIGRGFFVADGIPAFFKHEAVPRAHIITPNQFELAYLAAAELVTLTDVLVAARKVRETGPKLVMVTSLELDERRGELGILAETAAGTWVVWTPRLDIQLNGTGDAFTALTLAFWLATGGDAKATLEAVSAAMFGLVEATLVAGERELVLVAAQDRLAAPPRRFQAQRLR